MVTEQYDGVSALRERAYGPVPAGKLIVLEVRAVVGQKRSVPQERYAPRPGWQRPGGPQLLVRRVGQTQRRCDRVQPQFAAVSAAFGHDLGRHLAPLPPRGEPMDRVRTRRSNGRGDIMYWAAFVRRTVEILKYLYICIYRIDI